jgi:mannose-6-phosphate isomerase-like protein (cupin superfamily)
MATAIRLEDGQRFQMGGGDSRRLVDASVGASQLTLNYSIFQPGHEFPQHFHPASADVFIVLEGGVSVREGDHYSPIASGSLAYIPPGEVHGTVNTTTGQSTLISFQSPPDAGLYAGQRDPAVTGSVPKPPAGHVSRVQIKALQSGPVATSSSFRSWTPVSPGSGSPEMVVSYIEMEPGAALTIPATANSEAVWFVWAGEALLTAADSELLLGPHTAAFVPANQAQAVANPGRSMARLIRCEARPL